MALIGKMNAIIVLLALGLTAAMAAVPVLTRQTKIVGGNTAIISQYPSIAALVYAADGSSFYQSCVGTILTTKSIITAGHCLQGDIIYKWRARIGSSWSNSGGTLHILYSMLIHPNFNVRTMDSDIAVVYTLVPMVYSNVIKAATIASASYNLPDNQVVWAVGFGVPTTGNSEQLRHIYVWTINQTDCTSRYKLLGSDITSNMVCAGLIGSGTQCGGDSGGPLYHNDVIVGIYSWGFNCANAQYPGVNTRISRFTTWIQANSN